MRKMLTLLMRSCLQRKVPRNDQLCPYPIDQRNSNLSICRPSELLNIFVLHNLDVESMREYDKRRGRRTKIPIAMTEKHVKNGQINDIKSFPSTVEGILSLQKKIILWQGLKTSFDWTQICFSTTADIRSYANLYMHKKVISSGYLEEMYDQSQLISSDCETKVRIPTNLQSTHLLIIMSCHDSWGRGLDCVKFPRNISVAWLTRHRFVQILVDLMLGLIPHLLWKGLVGQFISIRTLSTHYIQANLKLLSACFETERYTLYRA